MTDPTEPDPRDELVKAIAEGRGCRGHYNCFATDEDTTEAGRDLDAYAAEILRGAAQSIRDVANRSSGDGYYTEATTERACAALLEAEAERLTEAPAVQAPVLCGDVRPLGFLGQPLGPCIVTGEHAEHRNLDGTRWARHTPAPQPDPYEQMRAAWQAIVEQAMRAMDAGTASVRASLTNPDQEQP